MRKRGIRWWVIPFCFAAVHAILPNDTFDLYHYYSDRFFIRSDSNKSATSYFITAKSKENAAEQFAILSPNCSLTNSVEEYPCSEDDHFCPDPLGSTVKTYQYKQDSCACNLEDCDQNQNITGSLVLYPGCFCEELEQQCDFTTSICPQWTQRSDHDELLFKVFRTNMANYFFKFFVQAGSETAVLHKRKVSMMSVPFRQSGFNCTLHFMHHFTHQSPSSRLVVRAYLSSGERRNLYEYSIKPTKTYWKHVNVDIGSFSEPFLISIDCETGSAPKRKSKNKPKETPKVFACGLADIYFEHCADIQNPPESCSRGDQFLCATPHNAKCLVNAQCDMRIDCDDGSDELDCGLLNGTMCDFNGSEFCGWYQVTRITEDQEKLQAATSTVAPLNKLDETPTYLLRLRSPTSAVREARKGSGQMLVYDAEALSLSRRTSILVSPELPRTNPEAYDPQSRLFETCKLRFYVCSRTYLKTWHIAIISKSINAFDSGRTILFETKYDPLQILQPVICEWERVMVNIPRQNAGFRIGIFVSNNFPTYDYFAIDDLSFSPSCFERDIIQSSWEIPDLLISTCGATGFDAPLNCDKQRVLDGQTGHFLKEDGTQEWTVPVTGFYRIEACGAAGGSTSVAKGESGNCVTLQVHLMENIALRMLIGQMGERACFTEQDDELRPSSCPKYSEPNKLGKRDKDAGAGGGGATLITVETDTWSVVSGGGAGASWPGDDVDVGYGASVIPQELDEKCSDICKKMTHKSFYVETREERCPGKKSNHTTVLGGFGGGGNSCGMIGGSGAGYHAGNPFSKGEGRSGTSHVDAGFSKKVVYYKADKVDEGYVKIALCRKQCALPAVCRFRNEYFKEEYCGCPDGSNFTDTSGTCACPLTCSSESTCQYRNYTFEPFCMCSNGNTLNENDSCEEVQPWKWYNFLLLMFVIIILLAAFAISFHYRTREKQMKKEIFDLTQMKSPDYLYDDIYFGRLTRKAALDTLPSIPRDAINKGNILGKGNFGEVFYGEYNGIKLAVKTISKAFSASQAAQADFCNEALCMGTFVDDNVVRLIGIDFDKLPYMIAIEFMEGGDLLSFVKEARPNQESLNPFHLTMCDLLKICCDVAAGCRCLETFGYVHRDIAARNILLTTKAVNRVAKIADFGMAKEIRYGSEYYRVHGRAMLPIKWTPPEAFIDGVFTTKSDIWSFGVLCWEVFSLGVVPYPNRRNEEVMLMLTEGARLEYPYGIPTKVYQLMRDCWKTSAESRPTFAEVVEEFEDIMHDPASVGMPFPIHPTVRACFAHSHSTPTSVETPMTALTGISLNSALSETSTVKAASTFNNTNMQDRIHLHELMLTREQPYNSDLTACVVDSLRKDLARVQCESRSIGAPQPEYLSPESIDEFITLIPRNTVTDQTPPTSVIDLNRLIVQNTGPTLRRPDSLNFDDEYSGVPFLECKTG